MSDEENKQDPTVEISVTSAFPELPEKLVIELGYFASDWARIEQNILVHLLEMRKGDASGIPLGFTRLRKEWLVECRKQLTGSDLAEAERLNDRLSRRAEARNYAIHGTWTVVSEDEYLATVLEKTKDQKGIAKLSLPMPYATLTEQADLLRHLRLDLWAFLDRVL